MSTTIVFFGSGPVAATSLELLAEDFEIEAVVTKPKPAHHSSTFPVIEVANKLDLPIHTVSNKAELSELIARKPFKSQLGVLIDFGIIVGQDVIDYFPLGIVNSHFSLLPEWRGADPITFAVLSGQSQTGISLMLLVEAMDEGPLLATAPFQLEAGVTTPSLTDALIDLSHKTLQTVLPLYIEGKLRPVPQDLTIPPTYSRKLTKEDGLIDWTKPARQIEREIRAYAEWPKSRTTFASRDVVITKAHVAESDNTGHKLKQGQIFRTDDNLIGVATSKGILVIDRLKPAGKREMSVREFLAGNQLHDSF